MASRNGPQVAGTDGADFLHRERIASHYKVSSTYKGYMKMICFLHFSLGLLMLLRLSTTLYVMAGIRPPAALQKLRLPLPDGWELMWLPSVLAPILALISIRKNKVFLMKQYQLGVFIFGLLPIAYGIFDNFDDIKEYMQSKKAARLFLGFPRVMLDSIFFLICVQVHGFGLYFAQQLTKAWTPVRKLKKME